MTEETPDQRGPIILTEAAKDHLETAARAHGLWRFGVRVKLVHASDPGRGFDLSFEELPEQGDHVLRSRGLRFFVADDVLGAIPDPTVVDHNQRGFTFRRS